MGANLRLRYLRKPEFAQLMQVSEKTIDEWRKSGRLKEGEDYILTPGGSTRFFTPDYKDERAARRAILQIELEDAAKEQTVDEEHARLDRYYRRHYGLTLLEYDDLLERQESACAICFTPVIDRSLHVDHDHISGSVRGLLCRGCNMGLGNFLDSVEHLRNAIRYLESPPYFKRHQEENDDNA